MKIENIQEIVISVLKDILEVFEIKAEIDENTFIYGKKGLLTSMGLVSFVVALEEKIFEETQRRIEIVSDKSFSHFHNPFYNVQSTAKFVSEILNDSK